MCHVDPRVQALRGISELAELLSHIYPNKDEFETQFQRRIEKILRYDNPHQGSGT